MKLKDFLKTFWIPSYGREYKSPAAVLADWQARLETQGVNK